MFASLTKRLNRRRRPNKAEATVSRDMVMWAYRRLLDQEPESEEVILAAMRLESPLALLEAILDSAEFRAHDATHRMHHYAPPLDVEWQVPPALAGQLLSRVTDTGNISVKNVHIGPFFRVPNTCRKMRRQGSTHFTKAE